jgi:hypothetical protein
MSTPARELEAPLAHDVLRYLDCPRETPNVEALNRLIHAFIRKAPWESVTRLLKRHTVSDTARCPRWPDEVWRDALAFNGGGTCFEINQAFFSLLTWLGYDGYLTLNDIEAARDCHAAIIVVVSGRKYLVDVSLPLSGALALRPDADADLHAPWLTYTVRPQTGHLYSVERSPHPRPRLFTLKDTPIAGPAYARAVENDYGPAGHFLDRVVINKVVGERAWLFKSDAQPYRLEAFDRGGRREIHLPPDDVPRSLADFYQLPADKVAAALALTQAPPDRPDGREASAT